MQQNLKVILEYKKIIANPLYDTAFKYLMENLETARFFVETIIGEQVVEINVAADPEHQRMLEAEWLAKLEEEEVENLEKELAEERKAR